jgi:hypothetical protein
MWIDLVSLFVAIAFAYLVYLTIKHGPMKS